MYKLNEFIENISNEHISIIGKPILFKDSNIISDGKNNKIVFGSNVKVINCNIRLIGDNNLFFIGDFVTIRGNYLLDTGSEIRIGSRTIFNFVVDIEARESRKIIIGENCLFSRCRIQTSDVHSIFDRDSLKRINFAKDVYIDSNVWVAFDALICKGSHIRQNSVIGARSLIAGKFPENSIIAGNPAKVIRKNILWDTKLLDTLDLKEKNMNIITFSELLRKRQNDGLKLNPIDSLSMEYKSDHHKNLKDPVLGVVKENDCILTKNFFVLTKDNLFIKDISYEKYNDYAKDITYEEIIEEPCFLVGGDTNYYHNLINWIPRLFLYEALNLNCKIVVNSSFSKRQLEVISSIFPYIKDKIVKVNKNIKFKCLYIPNFFLNPIHSPYAIRNLRMRLFTLYREEIVQPLFPTKFIISRSDASTRKIVNEQELFESLKDFGFSLISLDKLTFIEQINLFYHAEMVISPHGASLTNLLWCNHRPRVVEIINEHYTKVFWSLGVLCGVKNYDVFCGKVIIDSHEVNIHRNIEVDIDLLLSKIKKYLS